MKFDKEFLLKFVNTFKGLLVRILLIVHASLAVDFLITEKNLDGPYYVLLLPIILVGIEGIVITILQTRQDVTRFWPVCAILYLASVIPIIWISEFDAMETKTRTYGTLIGMWTKLGMFFVLIAGRWIVSLGDLSRDEVTVLLLALVGHAPDAMALLSTLDEKMEEESGDNTNKTYKLIVVLTVFTLSVIQFGIKTPDIGDNNKKIANNKNVDASKYFDLNCFKGRLSPPSLGEGSKLSTFKDKAKQMSVHAKEAKEKAQAKVIIIYLFIIHKINWQ